MAYPLDERLADEAAAEMVQVEAEVDRLRGEASAAFGESKGLFDSVTEWDPEHGSTADQYIEGWLDTVQAFARRMSSTGQSMVDTLRKIDVQAVSDDLRARGYDPGKMTPEEFERALQQGEVAKRQPWLAAVYGRVDGAALARDWPGASKALAQNYGPGIFRKKNKGGVALDELADELKRDGLLPEGAGADELVEMLKDGGGKRLFQDEDFGTSFPEYSGKPIEAIEKLLLEKQGYVPGAFDKEGLGKVDFLWGKPGKKGFGLAHIIERRNAQGLDGEAFVRSLPKLIAEGTVEHRREYQNRAYIVHNGSEAVIRLDWDGKKRAWLVTAYPLEETLKAPGGGRTYHQTYEKGKTPPFNSENVIKIDSKEPPVNLNTAQRGSVTIQPEKYVISLFDNADLSTLLHETGHVFLEEMDSALARGLGDDAMRADMETLRGWLGAEEGKPLGKGQREKFARGFEQYLREGQAPTRNLQGVFERFRHWLTSIYKSARQLEAELTPEVREVFDRMLRLETDPAPRFVDAAPNPLPQRFTADVMEGRPEAYELEAARLMDEGLVSEEDVRMLQEADAEAARIEHLEETGLAILDCVLGAV